MRLKLAFLAFAAAAALDVCAIVQPAPAAAQVRLPALGEAEGDELGIADERKVGDRIMREIYADPSVIDDPVVFDYVNGIFQKLLAAAERRGNVSEEMQETFAWAPFLVQDRTFNAFALPGGYIGVHLGLIAAAGTRDELASVLGHELSHITQRHIARSAVANKHQSIATLVAMVLGLLATAKTGNADVPMAILTSGQATIATNQLTFSREMEREADRFGLDVMTEAGYAPSGMASMFERLDTAMRLNDTNQYPWLRSHPLTIERLAEARLRARSVPAADPRTLGVFEHALMRIRSRAIMDTSDPALRALQQQGRSEAPLNDAERLAALYGAVLASVELRDFEAADGFLAKAQKALAQHAEVAAAWAAAHPGEPGATPAAKAEVASAAASAPTFAALFAPASAASGASTPAPGVQPVWPIEPIVLRDFKLLRLQVAAAHPTPGALSASEADLADDGSRAVALARAQAALARSVSRDPQANAALKRETEALQTWVAVHPKDSLAWSLLAQCAEPLGEKLRAIRAEAESHAARGDVIGALDRLHAGQRVARTSNADFVEASIIDARTREMEIRRRELSKEFGDR